MKKILLLDGNTRSALAVTRSLGILGHNIEVGEIGSTTSISSSSRYSKGYFNYPNPQEDQSNFLHAIINKLESMHYDFLIATSDHTLEVLYQEEKQIRTLTNFPFVTKDIFDKVQDKAKLLEIAKKHDICVPRTQKLIAGKDDIESNLDSLRDCHFPLFLKPRISSQKNFNGSLTKAPNGLVNNIQEARAFLSNPQLEGIKFLAQEQITGDGEGLFFLFKGGECIANFSHKRILEKPPSGGVSVLSKSIKTDEKLFKDTLRLLKDLQWEGVAMVEFKRGEDNIPYLMEINPRFWGSLQLAIDCGVNFPARLIETDLNKVQLSNYKLDQNLRWELGSLDHAFIRVKQEGLSYLQKLFVKNALRCFNKQTKLELLRLNDPGPFFKEIINYLNIC